MKNPEQMTSEELKATLLSSGVPEVGIDEEDSEGYIPAEMELAEEVTNTEEVEEVEPESEEVEELDPVAYLERLNAERQKEQLDAMSATDRSVILRAAKQEQEEFARGMINDFEHDVTDLADRYGQNLVSQFASDVKLGKIPRRLQLSEHEIRTLENPMETQFLKWLDGPKVRKEMSVDDIAEIIRVASGPPLSSRTRDRFFGFNNNKPKGQKFTAKQIRQNLDTYDNE